MKELVLRSVFDPQDFSLQVTERPLGFWFALDVPDMATKGLTISLFDARKLRDFLNKELGEQAPGPMGTGPWVYLETNRAGDNVWEQFPSLERAKEFASKRTYLGLKTQAVALLHQQLVPVVTTTYEWKDL